MRFSSADQLDHHVQHHRIGTSDAQPARRNVNTGTDVRSNDTTAFVNSCNGAGNRQPLGFPSITKYLLERSSVADGGIQWIALRSGVVTEIHTIHFPGAAAVV